MSEPTRTPRAPADKRLTYQQWKRRKMLRLARNWVLFLAGCAAVVALLTGGILWLLPKVHGLLAGPKVFAASVYDGTDYVFNAADARLTLVNAILRRIENTAQVIVDTADCAIGIDAANLVLMGLKGFRDDYEEHILRHRCLGGLKNPVPCVALCPAGVDIPGYIALINAGRYDDAVAFFLGTRNNTHFMKFQFSAPPSILDFFYFY